MKNLENSIYSVNINTKKDVDDVFAYISSFQVQRLHLINDDFDFQVFSYFCDRFLSYNKYINLDVSDRVLDESLIKRFGEALLNKTQFFELSMQCDNAKNFDDFAKYLYNAKISKLYCHFNGHGKDFYPAIKMLLYKNHSLYDAYLTFDNLDQELIVTAALPIILKNKLAYVSFYMANQMHFLPLAIKNIAAFNVNNRLKAIQHGYDYPYMQPITKENNQKLENFYVQFSIINLTLKEQLPLNIFQRYSLYYFFNMLSESDRVFYKEYCTNKLHTSISNKDVDFNKMLIELKKSMLGNYYPIIKGKISNDMFDGDPKSEQVPIQFLPLDMIKEIFSHFSGANLLVPALAKKYTLVRDFIEAGNIDQSIAKLDNAKFFSLFSAFLNEHIYSCLEFNLQTKENTLTTMVKHAEVRGLKLQKTIN